MFPPDQLRLLTCLFLSVIVSFVLGKIQSPKKFILVSVISTILLQAYVFRQEVLILYIQQQLVYLICKYAPRSKVGKIVLFQTFAYLFLVQLRRMWIAYAQNNIDITAVLMMQVFLYVGFAYNLQDGADQTKKESPRRIQTLPPYYVYIGYVFFLPSTLVGPVFEFRDYHDYLHRRSGYSTLKSTIPGMLQQLRTLGCVATVYIVVMPFKLQFVLSEQYLQQYSIGYKLLYVLIAMFAVRFQYYGAWSLGMVAMNASGITYNPVMKKNSNGETYLHEERWDKITVSEIWAFQTTESMKVKADAWNQSVQLALKRYVYDRVCQIKSTDTESQIRTKKRMAQQRTLFTSALWHGLYPGYFVSFFHWALILQISQQLFRIRRQSARFNQICQKYRLIEVLFFSFYISYFGVFFVFMTMDSIMQFAATMYYIPPVIIYIANILIVRLRIFNKIVHGKKQIAKKTFSASNDAQAQKAAVQVSTSTSIQTMENDNNQRKQKAY